MKIAANKTRAYIVLPEPSNERQQAIWDFLNNYPKEMEKSIGFRNRTENILSLMLSDSSENGFRKEHWHISAPYLCIPNKEILFPMHSVMRHLT